MPENCIVRNSQPSGIAPNVGAVIWLHGLGADGHDFASLVPQLQLAQPIRFIFPHAPKRPITINAGFSMPGWFDITNIESLDSDIDQNGLNQSCKCIAALAADEAKHLGWDKIILAGFSQGGAVVNQLLSVLPQRPAGVLCLSTWAPAKITAVTDLHGLPALVMHGNDDSVIAPHHGTHLAEMLRSSGLDVDERTYPMAHQVCAQQIADIGAWIGRLLPSQ